MGKITLYGMDFSPPVRAVLLTLKALDLPHEYIQVNLWAKDNQPKSFKANPQHTVPTLDDDGNIMWDSHAINAYLVTKYGADDSLYPKDPLARVVVDQRLHFDSGILFQGGLRNITLPMFKRGEKEINQHQIDAIIDGYNLAEKFLAEHDYIAGDNLTIADFSAVTTITALEVFKPIDEDKYPNLTAWIRRLEQLPYYEEACGNGLKQYNEFIKSKLA